MIERMLRTARTWALVDTLAEHVMGGLVERYPELTATLDRWAGDDDFWLRRSAMLALLRPLRRGDGDFDRFSRYADRMLEEKEFFIRKAIGWILRDTAKRQAQPGRRVAGAAGAPGLGGHGPRGGQAAPARGPRRAAGRLRRPAERGVAGPLRRSPGATRYDRRARASAAGGSPASRVLSLVRWAWSA